MLSIADSITVMSLRDRIVDAKSGPKVAGLPRRPTRTVDRAALLLQHGYDAWSRDSAPSQTMLEKVLLGRETTFRYMQMFDIKLAPWSEPSWFKKSGDKTEPEIGPEVLRSVSEVASQFTSLADGEAPV